MSKVPTLREMPDLPPEVIQAGLNGQLILFVGAGISMLLGLPSWNGLAQKALEELRERRLLDYSELDQLKALDPRTTLSIARLIAADNDYELDLTRHFKGKAEEHSVYKAINDIGCTCVTTNYDELLAPRFLDAKDGSMTARALIRLCNREEFFARRLDEPGVVVHIHGAISQPKTMVVTTRDYLEHYDHENLQHFLGELFAKKTVLFLGYGLEETEILEHILRRGSAGPTKDRRRFTLQGFFRSQEPLYQKLYRYYQMSFGVHLIGFVRDHEDYHQQDSIIRAWAPKIKINKPALVDDIERMNEVLRNG